MRSSDGPPKLNVLVAFPYCSKDFLRFFKARGDQLRILIDSGAFTAWKQGTQITIDEYCSFLDAMPVKPWRYFMLDVIGDPAATWKNYEIMRKRGFDPIPIFTRGEDFDHLDRYYDRTDVVGVGGLVRTQRNRAFVNGIMKRIGKRRVHLLGFSDLNFLKSYKPYSCDSSGWNQQAYGQLRLYMGAGQFAYLSQQEARESIPEPVADRLRFYGLEPYTLRNKAGWGSGPVRDRAAFIACCRGMSHASFEIEKMLGTKYFFAETAVYNLAELYNGWEWAHEQGACRS